jgi:RpiR family carbohydrate utilization transcriptional regulator
MLERLHQRLPVLSPAEARVAQLVLAQPHAFARTAVAELARQAQVSPPTVVRFCRSMGAQGLHDFKLRLAAALYGSSSSVHPLVEENDSIASLASKVIEGATQALRSVALTMNTSVVEKIVSAMLTAKRIDFVGVGQSSLVAQDAQQKLFRFGIVCSAYSDVAMQMISASQLNKDDVLVLISAGGRSPEPYDVLKVARKRGARIASISPSDCKLARLSDWALYAEPLDDPNIHLPMLSRIQHLAIIDVLAVALAQRLGEQGKEHLKYTKEVLASRRKEYP